MNILENDFLKVELHPKGAEIISIVGKQDEINYMWKRDPRQWSSSAPILFPIIGKVRNDTLLIEGKKYNLTGHGFSRHHEYDVVESSSTHVLYELKQNDEILKIYPYHFVLQVHYTLEQNVLSCTCIVKNIDSKEIAFQVGGHPAFACPFYDNESSNDYYIEFNKPETVKQKVLDVNTSTMTKEEKLFFENERRFFVRQELFNKDAIVLEDFKSDIVSLKSLNHSKSIDFHMEGFTHLGIWAAKHVGDLLAIEPWVGHTDYVDFEGDIKEKVGVKLLEQNGMFECTFKVQINQ